MKFITVQNGALQTADPLISSSGWATRRQETFAFGMNELDALFPSGGLPAGAVHEILHDNGEFPVFFAALLARRVLESQQDAQRLLIWSDPAGSFYPPAVQQLGVELSKLYLLHPRSAEDEFKMIGECMACQAVGAVVASCGRLSQVQARRLQLAAERGGGVGILVRPAGAASAIYAAATRWKVTPAPGERAVQRWKVELLHGHGGRIGKSVYLEYCRETHTVHSSSQLVHRPLPAKTLSA